MKLALVIVLLACAPLSALAQTAVLQSSTTVQQAASGSAEPVLVTPGSKEQYAQAKANAQAVYKAERAQCDSLAGTPKDICVAQAKARRVSAEEDATAQYKNTLKAYTQARMRIATANYQLDRARCGAFAGNERDVCLGQAKATRIAAEADARADRQSFEARANAREQKRIAQYKVALEKCDAFAGTVKDNCVSAAKSAYGE